MPEKYHIKTSPTPPRFQRIGKFATVDWREDCSRCTNCVKLRCTYNVYDSSMAHDRNPQAPRRPLFECKGCMSCVQGCTKGLLSLSVNPEYLAMGDEYWRPEIITTTWDQAETGRIPVSGAGYRGRFSAPGFDSIWTDMSEIVRPTRDGIHGREYISTAVDIGPKPMRLEFSPDGAMLTPEASLIVAQLPVILDVPQWSMAGSSEPLSQARAASAVALKTLAVVSSGELSRIPPKQMPSVVPLLEGASAATAAKLPGGVRMVEVADEDGAAETLRAVSASRPEVTLCVRMPLADHSAERVLHWSQAGVKVFHLCADLHGCEVGPARPRHIKDAVRALHCRLVEAGVRDEITVIVGGGIALAEHVAKAIICGSDVVSADTALLVGLGCTVCGDCGHGKANGSWGRSCPVVIDESAAAYAAGRMINLLGTWHSQLIEVLGAMGIREMRRLRGETGRAIFREDMEREAFGDLIRK
jgi:ferredoxin